jgi:hypothetical protein
MQAASSVGFAITVSQVGSDTAACTAPISLSPANGWQPIVTLDEDELLQRLQTSLIQALNKPSGKFFYTRGSIFVIDKAVKCDFRV